MNLKVRKLLRAPGELASFLRALRQMRRQGGIVRASIYTVNHSDILSGKRVLVTGGSHGIGFAIAKRFIASGAKVVATGRNEADLKAASEQIASDRFSWISWDVADIAAIEPGLDKAQSLAGGKIDVLVNNAGVLTNDQFPNVTEAGWDKVYAVNSKGLFFLTQTLCRRWIADGVGTRKVINISSTSGFTPGAYPYRMSKWDVVGMTQGLALNLAPHGIIVNGIAPGRTSGRMLGIGGENIYDADVPIGRSAFPEEIAELALFLAGDTSNYITGQTIICDGGLTLVHYKQ